MDNSNGLTAAETERVSQMVEECGEVVQVIGKILRHGWKPTDHSVVPPRHYDNRTMLERELGDLKARLVRLINAGDISANEVDRHMTAKLLDLSYDHHQ